MKFNWVVVNEELDIERCEINIYPICSVSLMVAKQAENNLYRCNIHSHDSFNENYWMFDTNGNKSNNIWGIKNKDFAKNFVQLTFINLLMKLKIDLDNIIRGDNK